MDLPLAFALVTIGALAFYVLADGFDLGIGVLFLFAPRDRDRDLMMQSIAPVWDGNETWIVFSGGLLWAAFPIAYYVLLPGLLPAAPAHAGLHSSCEESRLDSASRRARSASCGTSAFAGGSVLAVVAQGFILGGFIGGHSGGPTVRSPAARSPVSPSSACSVPLA